MTSAARWNVASSIVRAWVIALPASGLVAARFYDLARLRVALLSPERSERGRG
ncbi:hypothetical protein [Phenylobacterium sp.]|uniref:hypothetical protein n=1 Tax=Phenylobacterium sp. TaxID=1871053 RepID=UPI0025E4D27F|nr:hypothetical protein [Phenylobacterium sp.]